jgi:hypothetical protein
MAASHTWVELSQWRLRQSLALSHVLPVPQGFPSAEQTGPPQSMSVSFWFSTPSVHVGAAQMSDEQTPLWQSAFTLHFK